MSKQGLISRLLEPGGIGVAFQPIFEVHGEDVRLHGVEGLSRGPSGSGLEAADVLFRFARDERVEGVVDRACVSQIFLEAMELPPETKLSVNVHATTLATDDDFPEFFQDAAKERGIQVERLTLEIVEYSTSFCRTSFLASLERLRGAGISIALDDIGAADSNYRRILECRPDYFKIDRYFVHGAYGDVYRQAVLESVADLGQKLGARVIAEGVEEMKDLHTLVEAGIDLVQGFLFSRPLPSAELRSRGLLGREAGAFTTTRLWLEGPTVES